MPIAVRARGSMRVARAHVCGALRVVPGRGADWNPYLTLPTFTFGMTGAGERRARCAVVVRLRAACYPHPPSPNHPHPRPTWPRRAEHRLSITTARPFHTQRSPPCLTPRPQAARRVARCRGSFIVMISSRSHGSSRAPGPPAAAPAAQRAGGSGRGAPPRPLARRRPPASQSRTWV